MLSKRESCFVVVAAVITGSVNGHNGTAHYAHFVVQCSENLRERIFMCGDGSLSSDCALDLDMDHDKPQASGLWLLQGDIADDPDLEEDYVLPVWQVATETAYAWRQLQEHEAVLVSRGQPLDGMLALDAAVQPRPNLAEVSS